MATARAGKPDKPTPDFPLFAHASGVWAKKIRGKLHYFGSWDNPIAALDKYEREKAALHAGRTPRPSTEQFTVKDLVNHFLAAQEDRLASGDITSATHRYYTSAATCLVEHFKRRPVVDLVPEDFAKLRKVISDRWGPYRVSNTVQYIRGIFKFGFESGLVDRPMQFGPGFKRPKKKVLRVHRRDSGKKLFTADEVRWLIDGALVPGDEGPKLVRPSVQLRAMLLLGINGGFGNTDCSTLPKDVVDLNGAVIDYARGKTGVERRCTLWPETVQALRDAIAQRPAAKSPADDGRVFLTKYGLPWVKDNDDAVSKETAKLMRRLGIARGLGIARKGRNYYTLRHTFRTVAGEAKDQPAANYLMGHESNNMSEVYTEDISDQRLRAVTEHVRTWLFGDQIAGK